MRVIMINGPMEVFDITLVCSEEELEKDGGMIQFVTGEQKNGWMGKESLPYFCRQETVINTENIEIEKVVDVIMKRSI